MVGAFVFRCCYGHGSASVLRFLTGPKHNGGSNEGDCVLQKATLAVFTTKLRRLQTVASSLSLQQQKRLASEPVRSVPLPASSANSSTEMAPRLNVAGVN
jgi:hypothetical protein